MADRRIALWLLNRVAGSEWNHAAMASALRGGFLGFGGNDVVLGQRPDLPAAEAGVLMHEGKESDEYFVPIPVKCLGDPDILKAPPAFWQSIAACYSHYYGEKAEFPWASYWQNARNPSPKQVLPDVRMVSPKGVGYYRMLQEYSEKNPGTRHVLIGYSQGGLVARYLAYLDEHVFDNALIDGVVMVDTPNFGSPLARPENAKNVLQSLSLVVAGFAQLDEQAFPGVAARLRGLADPPRSVDLPWVLDFVDDILLTLHANPEAKKKKAGLFNFLATARKWLSGLEDQSTSPNHVFAHKESAFYDLDIGLLDKPGSVLHEVNAYPLRRIRHAAIVGSDNELDGLVEAGIEAFADGHGLLISLLGGFAANHLKARLREVLTIAGDAYKNAMREQSLTESSETIRVRTRDFVNGVAADDARYAFQTRTNLDRLAHDFVIPSAYQLIEKVNNAAFLGNWVNPAASHLSGADPRHDGKASQDYLLDILKLIRNPMPMPATDRAPSPRPAGAETQPRAEPA